MKILEAEKSRILSTKEYSLFKYEPKIRFYPKRLEFLINEMKKKNISKDVPIIIDAQYNILDGIYRFEANRQLQALVYYKVAEIANKLDLKKASSITCSLLHWEPASFTPWDSTLENHSRIPDVDSSALDSMKTTPAGREYDSLVKGRAHE